MAKYYFVGTIQEAKDRIWDNAPLHESGSGNLYVKQEIFKEFFLDKKAVKKEYGSLARMKEIHGAKYVKNITINKKVYDRNKAKPYVIINGKRSYL